MVDKVFVVLGNVGIVLEEGIENVVIFGIDLIVLV